jgi:two-component system, sensor histidine kinase and response regulator
VSEKTVLVVDDEPDIRDALRDILEDEGYRVEHAANGAEALSLLSTLPRPCAVILDIIMPVMDGAQVYSVIRSDPRLADIPLLISTSDPSRAPKGSLIMSKPIDLQRLVSTVASLFR